MGHVPKLKRFALSSFAAKVILQPSVGPCYSERCLLWRNKKANLFWVLDTSGCVTIIFHPCNLAKPQYMYLLLKYEIQISANIEITTQISHDHTTRETFLIFGHCWNAGSVMLSLSCQTRKKVWRNVWKPYLINQSGTDIFFFYMWKVIY